MPAAAAPAARHHRSMPVSQPPIVKARVSGPTNPNLRRLLLLHMQARAELLRAGPAQAATGTEG